MEDATMQDTCFGSGSLAGAVIGTFLTTILLLAVAAFLYRQWRRHKGKHLVLVTDPEIVDDAYAFDNPCFKDATPTVARLMERPSSVVSGDTPAKDSARWSTPWTSLGLGSAIRSDKRRTLDDSYLGPKATTVSVVGLRSHDFTGLGFNVCGNMREGIFVKDLLHRGPASESGRIHPGDRIASVKISFRNMVYEDALTILSYASPYDVELEVENGGSGSKPTTLLKKSVGPSPTRICHPLYRSQSIPELSHNRKSIAKRLFIADPNESAASSAHSTVNCAQKSTKSTPASQSIERRHDEARNNHHKFGIKVLPALDGTVHRIENQNEHNTNLERRHSKKMDAEKSLVKRNSVPSSVDKQAFDADERQLCNERLRQKIPADLRGLDVPDKASKSSDDTELNIPSEVPTEVHNAAMAARRNRKSTSEPLNAHKISSSESEDAKSPQKNKRKAPAPPKATNEALAKKDAVVDTIDSIADYTESLCDYVKKAREDTDDAEGRRHRLEARSMANRRNSESDTDSEMQNSFTTIELNSADITVHRTPVPETNNRDEGDEDDDIYRKAASLGDLSKYESKAAATLERAQSLDMTTDTSSKKRKAPLPPDDINESTEDLTKLDQIDTFDRRKLKKSNEWGTLEDVIWSDAVAQADEKEKKSRTRKKSNGTLERSKSAVEIKLKGEATSEGDGDDRGDDDKNSDSIELYNLPLSKRLTEEFIRSERMFNPDEDNSLARIVNDGAIVKNPSLQEVSLDLELADEKREEIAVSDKSEDFSRALRYFEMHASASPTSSESALYVGRQAVEEPKVSKVTVNRGKCRGCEDRYSRHDTDCGHESIHRQPRPTNSPSDNDRITREKADKEADRCLASTQPPLPVSKSQPDKYKAQSPKQADSRDEKTEGKNGGVFSTFHVNRTKFEQRTDHPDRYSPIDSSYDVHFARRVINVSDDGATTRQQDDDVEEEENEYEFGTGVTVNSKNLSSPKEDRRNISNISVSSGENSEDSGLVRESMEYPQEPESRPPLPNTPVPNTGQKMTYVTEIKVSSNREGKTDSENDEIIAAAAESNGESRRVTQREIKVTSNGKPTSAKKPPVPPRRSDIAKSPKDDRTEQIVYVSEYKPTTGRGPHILDTHSSNVKQSENANKKFEHWIFLADKESNRWGTASGQPQPVTSIVLSSRDDTN